ncbi:MAG: DUF2442 domain-containing protein [Anaerolineales bacterium]|nr:DUF2442 domain-containing protein [Anaerolineales bacterium]
MNKIHNIQTAKADNDALYLTVDGIAYRLRWADCSPRLAKATLTERKHFEVSPSGYGIHWPEIDEDLAITPLIQSIGEVSGLPARVAATQIGEKKAEYKSKN